MVVEKEQMKKGQMKIQQMAFMLIAVTLFFVLVGLFFATTSLSNMQHKKAILDEEKASAVAISLAKSPELSCGTAFGTMKINCVDFDKAMLLVNNTAYSNLLGVKGVEIIKLSPNETGICTQETYPNCKFLFIKKPSEPGADKSTYVSLCHKEPYQGISYNKCEMAKLVVRY